MNSGIPAYNERAGADLPLGSRGGTAVRYTARWDGAYDIAVWLNANTNNESDRLPEDRFALRVPMKAGVHRVAVSFRRQTWPDETVQTVRNTTDYVPLPLEKPVDLPLDVWVDGQRAGTLTVPSFRVHPRYSQHNSRATCCSLMWRGRSMRAGMPTLPAARRCLSASRSGRRRKRLVQSAFWRVWRGGHGAGR